MKRTIEDIIHDPRFTGYGRFIFPDSWDRSKSSLDNIDRLLPYHTHIDASTTEAVIDFMAKEVDQGKRIFYDFYSEEQKREDPEKENTGLFFFRGMLNAPFALVCPGGGFSYVGSIHEGFPYAIELCEKGYNAFVIHYRLGSGRKATEDLAQAISWIFRNSMELDVSTKDYSLWGSSAGARMAAYIGSYGVEAFGGDALPKPSVIIMAYTGHTDISGEEPPTFAMVGAQDGIAHPQVMKRRIQALNQTGVETEFHEYPSLAHGFGLGIGTSAEHWIEDAIRFWNRRLETK